MSQATAAGISLPSALIGRADVARLILEVEKLDNDFETQKVRDHKDEANYAIPTMSRSLTDFLQLNNLNIASAKERTQLRKELKLVKDKTPVMHMTFAVDPDPEFLQLLTDWVRTNIHPQALLSVGLQPSLVGGVFVRTPNHIHDFSVRTLLSGKRDIIMTELESTPVELATPPAEESHEG